MAPAPDWTTLKSRVRAHWERMAENHRAQWAHAQDQWARGVFSDGAPLPAPGAAGAPWPRRHPIAAGLGAVLAGLILIGVLIALFWDWDRLRGPIARYAGASLHREVHIDGHLKVHLLTWTPQATVEGLRIGNAPWAGQKDLADIPRLVVQVKLLPLLGGRMVLPLLQLDRPELNLVRDGAGRANWVFDPSRQDQPTRLPPIQRILVDNGHLSLRDASRNLTLTGLVQASEAQSGGQAGDFQLTGQGVLNQEPFQLRIVGGPLIKVRTDRPYAFDLHASSRTTSIEARGAIDKPFDFGRFHAEVRLQGPDLSRLYTLTAVPFPNTPPYRLSGQFSRDGQTYAFRRMTGRMGESDLSGELTVSKPNGRRFLRADLTSTSLDWKDLAAVLGGAPRASAGASPQQKAAAKVMASRGRILPDATLNVTRLRKLDADVRFRASSVKLNRLKLTSVLLGAKLKDAVLDVDPVAFTFAQGALKGRVGIDARKDVPVTDVDLRLSNYALQAALPQRGGIPPLTGVLEGHARLSGAGLSVHQAAAAASGEVSVAVPHGEMRQAFAELLGINAANGLYLLLSKDQRKTDLRCAAADFRVQHGVLQARTFVIDTGVVVSQGSGQIDLAQERLDLQLAGRSKKPRILKLWAPILVKGSISHPTVGVDKTKLAGQGLLAAAGAALQPLAVIAPFLTGGGAKDIDCARLLTGVGYRWSPQTPEDRGG